VPEQRAFDVTANELAGHRALERVLPEQFLPMWARLGELAQAQAAKDAARAARDEKLKAQHLRQREQEVKESLNRHVVTMTDDHIDELYRLLTSDALSTGQASQDKWERAPFEARTHRALRELGLSEKQIREANLGVGGRAATEQALDWLVVHLPYAELPPVLRGRRGSAVRVVTGDNPALSTPAGRMLQKFGYSPTDVAAAMKDSAADAPNAAALCWKQLQEALCGIPVAGGGAADALLHACLGEDVAMPCEPGWVEPEASAGPLLGEWWNEQLGLIGVYPEQVVHASEHCFRMRVPVAEDLVALFECSERAGGASVELVVLQPHPHSTLPLLALRCSMLPAPVRLHYTRELCLHLQQQGSDCGVLHVAHAFLSERLVAASAPSGIAARYRFSTLLEAGSGRDTVDAGAAPVQAPQPRTKPRRGAAQTPRPLTPAQHAAESQQLLDALRSRRASNAGRAMQAARARLPAAQKKQVVVEAVASHRVVVISGATGCGKSTQVLAHGCHSAW
jgi:hypothetical protein